MPNILSKKYDITDPQLQASNLDEMFDDLYRQLSDSIGVSVDEGDLLIGNDANALVALVLGANGSFLRSGTDTPEWSTLILPNAAAVGDLIYASAANLLNRLAAVATGKALISQGVGVAPTWGLIDAATMLSGIAPVANGGTGRASHTAYAVICGGTTSTGAQQSVAALGSSGQVLTSNGAGALPTFQTAASGGTPTFQTTTLTGTQNDFALSSAYTLLRCNNVAQVDFTGFSIAGNPANEGDRCIVISINTTVTIANQNVGSNFLFRFITSTAGTLTLTIGQWAEMIYDGTTARWRVTNVGGSSGTNALLDGSAHSDTLAGTVARGDVIYGNSTPKWARLAKPAGASVLTNDATDVAWSTVPAVEGIKFPATQVASANANTLDDFEEGSWTPVIGGATSTTGQSYSAQRIGRYVKFGRMVLLTGYVLLTNKGTITGAVQLQGFPFPVYNVSGYFSAGSTAYTTLATANVAVNIEAVWNTSLANLYFKTVAALTPVAVQPADIANASDMEFSIMYETDS